MYAVPCLLPDVQDLDQRGLIDGGKRPCLAEECLHSLPKCRLVAQGSHDDMAVRRTIGERGGQILLDGDFAARRAIDALVHDTVSALANHADDVAIAQARADRQGGSRYGTDPCQRQSLAKSGSEGLLMLSATGEPGAQIDTYAIDRLFEADGVRHGQVHWFRIGLSGTGFRERGAPSEIKAICGWPDAIYLHYVLL